MGISLRSSGNFLSLIFHKLSLLKRVLYLSSAPNSKKQKEGWTTLEKIFSDKSNTWVIHYSCESFYDNPSGSSRRITSIAVRNLDSGQTHSFSIHQIAELQKVDLNEIESHYDVLERQMLDAFFSQHVKTHIGNKYLHWNMRDINYGFAAIEHRYRILGGEPMIISDDKKIDLSRLLIDIYGTGYIGHPRLETLLLKNSITIHNFLNGQKEAEAFEKREFVKLHQSTLRKVDVIANLAERVYNRQLRTNTSWWEMHGGRVRLVFKWLAENPFLLLLGTILTIIGSIIAIYKSNTK